MEKHINVAGPAYRGATIPKFKPKSVNESRFEDGLRCKEYNIYIDGQDGYIKWLAQAGNEPTSAWENEIKRTFKANGLENGSIIHVKFGSRRTGYAYEYDMTI